MNMGNNLGVLTFPKGIVHFGISDGVYTGKSSYKIRLLDKVIVQNGVNLNAFRAEGHFKWRQINLEKEVANGTYFLIKTNQFSPRFQKAQKATKTPSNIIDGEVGVGTNEDAQKELLDLSIEFPYAKPTSLVKFLGKMPFWTNKNISILDFFAGSGTTLHATMQLNAEDGGHRQCILVTNNENGICENVTYERNRRVIQGYTTPKGVEVAGLSGNNLRYYKTKLLPRRQSIKNKRALVNVSTDLLCIKNDVYTEQTHFAGRRLKTSCARYFDDGRTRMLVIYNELTVDAFAQTISQMEVEGKILIYVFSNTRYAFDDNFEEVLDRVELCALPAAIYDAYRNLLPEEKQEFEEPLAAAEEAEEAEEEVEGEARKGQLSFEFPTE